MPSRGQRVKTVRVALRFNPNVTANTHPHIATGHGGAKFGLPADTIRTLLENRADTPHLRYEGIHVHIGSQLHDTAATSEAVRAALDLIARYPFITTIDIGGGFPALYQQDESLPTASDFAATLASLLQGYNVILEPGRSIIADAGLLVARVLYVKEQGGQTFIVIDTGMSELIRPALYNAHHEIVPLSLSSDLQPENPPPSPARWDTRIVWERGSGGEGQSYTIVGPICETSDTIAKSVPLPPLQSGDYLAILSAGAYGMVMASNYNARPRPPEVVVAEDGHSWRIARRRETWADLVQYEI